MGPGSSAGSKPSGSRWSSRAGSSGAQPGRRQRGAEGVGPILVEAERELGGPSWVGDKGRIRFDWLAIGNRSLFLVSDKLVTEHLICILDSD